MDIKFGETTWRYQAVYNVKEIEDGKKHYTFSVCEVYLDEDGKLCMWTEDAFMKPIGEIHAELIQDLEHMLKDVKEWEPVRFDSLEEGMTFEKRKSAESEDVFIPHIHTCELQYFEEESWVEQCPLNLTEENNMVDDCVFCTHFITIDFDTINKDFITEVHRSGENTHGPKHKAINSRKTT